MNAQSENDQDHNAWPEFSELITLSDAAERIGVEPSLLEYLWTEGLLCPYFSPGTEIIYFYQADLFAFINAAERHGYSLEQILPYDLYLRIYQEDDATDICARQQEAMGDADSDAKQNNENFLNLDSVHSILSDVRVLLHGEQT